MGEEIQSSIQKAVKRWRFITDAFLYTLVNSRTVFSMSSRIQQEALFAVYRSFRDGTSHTLSYRCRFIYQVLVPLASLCDEISLIEFYKCHVVEVMETVKKEITQASAVVKSNY